MSTRSIADAPLPLKALREAQQPKLSQNDLIHRVANRTGVQLSVQTINAIENAKTVPSVTTAQAIARALDVPTDAIAWPTPEVVRDNESSRRNRSVRQVVESLRVETVEWLQRQAAGPGWRVEDKVQQNVAADPRAVPAVTFRFAVYNPQGFPCYISSREDLEQLKADFAE